MHTSPLRTASSRRSIAGGIALFGVAAWLLAACGAASLEQRTLEAQNANLGPRACYDGTDAPAVDLDLLDTAEALEGSWAQVQVNTSLSSAPMLGDITTTTTTYLLIEGVLTDNGVVFESQVCDIRVSNNPDTVSTTVPAAFQAAIGVEEHPAILEEFQEGVRVYQPGQPRVMGADLATVDAELPDDPDDPGVVDEDGDGHPGVTILVGGVVSGEIYVAQRISKELCGYMTSPTTFDGAISWAMDRSTLDASSFMLSGNRSSVPTQDPEHNYFRTTRLAEDQPAECATVLEQAETLFARDSGNAGNAGN